MLNHKLFAQEDGFVLVTSMLIMVVLTVIGLSATSTSTIELQIAGNDRIAKENFYAAEAASLDAAARLEDETSSDELMAARSSKRWLQSPDGQGEDPVGPETITATWQAEEFSNMLVSQIDDGSSHVKLAAVDHGIAKGEKGSSLKMTSTSVHAYHLYGYSENRNSWELIEIGYKKRF